MKTTIQMMIVLTMTVAALAGCGKKDAEAVLVQLPGDSETNQSVEQNPIYEASYNLMENQTVSRATCDDLLQTSLNQNEVMTYAIKKQSEKIKEICGKSPAYQGTTALKYVCKQITSTSYTPEAAASTPYRCN